MISRWGSARSQIFTSKRTLPLSSSVSLPSVLGVGFLAAERASGCFTDSGPRCLRDVRRQGNQSIWWPDAG